MIEKRKLLCRHGPVSSRLHCAEEAIRRVRRQTLWTTSIIQSTKTYTFQRIMPTPSADQTLDDIPSTTHQFSTCPDDLQHPPRPGDISIGPDPSLDELSSGALGIDSPSHVHMSSIRDSDLVDNNHRDPSSRDTTVSPGPPLVTSGIPSSEHSSELPLFLKGRATSPDEPSSCRPAQSKHVEQHGQPTKHSGAFEMAVINVEDGAYNYPSMGSDYSSMRVRGIKPKSYRDLANLY